METTTIQIRKDQAEQLKTIKAPSGNYKTAIDDLLECYNETTTDAPAGDLDIEAIAREVNARLDTAQIANATADEVEERLRR